MTICNSPPPPPDPDRVDLDDQTAEFISNIVGWEIDDDEIKGIQDELCRSGMDVLNLWKAIQILNCRLVPSDSPTPIQLSQRELEIISDSLHFFVCQQSILAQKIRQNAKRTDEPNPELN